MEGKLHITIQNFASRPSTKQAIQFQEKVKNYKVRRLNQDKVPQVSTTKEVPTIRTYIDCS